MDEQKAQRDLHPEWGEPEQGFQRPAQDAEGQ